MDEPTEKPESTHPPSYGPPWVRTLWLTLGFLFVGLGLIGVILPGLPTTPFLLLAAACFSKSSLRFYNMLLDNRWFGQGIRDYRNGLGVPMRIKIVAIAMMWIFVSVAVFVLIPEDQLLYRIVVGVAGLVGTVYVARLKTRRPPSKSARVGEG